MINLPLFSQRDDLWKLKKLGNSSLTIGAAGCLLTCLAMVSKYYGHETTPDQLNQDLLRVNGYALDSATGKLDLYIWNSITKVYSDVTEPKMVMTPQAVTSTQFSEIDTELEAGRPVIIEVDFNPGTVAIEMHFIVIVGKDINGNYIVADPWYGDVGANLGRYGKPSVTIQRYIFTFGPMPTQPVNNPNIDEQNALAVVKEGFLELPATDDLKQGNMEGYSRAITSEHLTFGQNLAKAQAFDAFIAKWFGEWMLHDDPNKSQQVILEEEMGKYLTLEDKYEALRGAAVGVMGEFATDDGLIVALKNEANDKQILIDKVKDYETGAGKKVLKTFSIFGYPIKIYARG